VRAGHPERTRVMPVRGQGIGPYLSVSTSRRNPGQHRCGLADRAWQIERTSWRGTLAGLPRDDLRHLDGRVHHLPTEPHVVGRYRGRLPVKFWRKRKKRARHAVEMTTRRGSAEKLQKRVFPLLPYRAWNPAQIAGFPHSHSDDGGGGPQICAGEKKTKPGQINCYEIRNNSQTKLEHNGSTSSCETPPIQSVTCLSFTLRQVIQNGQQLSYQCGWRGTASIQSGRAGDRHILSLGHSPLGIAIIGGLTAYVHSP